MNMNAQSSFNDYEFLQDITFKLYNDNLAPYQLPERSKSVEESLLYDVIHAVWSENKWVAYTLNKNLLGTYKVGSPALLDKGDFKRVVFLANFPGSRGGTDLYMAEYANGAWSNPRNMGDGVNSSYNESNPGFLDDNTLTFSSNGVIKKVDLNSFLVETVNNNATTASNNTPPVIKNEVKPTAPVVVKTNSPVVSSNSIITYNNQPLKLGVQDKESMKAQYPNAIQLGVFSNPNWGILKQFATLGNLVSFQNSSGINTVWLTGYDSMSQANEVLGKVRSYSGFEKSFIVK
ncbi:MAG: hypothetical protein H6553_12520 [Chitinophagales bacterium]|nr:hypothetical protein [Chitinophagales bacterium]